MEIRSDITSLNKTNKTGLFRSITKGTDKYATIDTTDSLAKAEVTDNSFRRPEVGASETGKTNKAGSSKQGLSDYKTPTVTGVDATPGVVAAIVATQLQKLENLGVTYELKPAVPLPFVSNKQIDAKEAASILSADDNKMSGRLRAKIDGITPLPLADLNDVGELSAFRGVGVMPARWEELAEFLKYAGEQKLEFRTDDRKNVGEYGAYNLLTTGWEAAGQKPETVNITFGGVGIMTLKPGEHRSFQELKKEFEETLEAVEKLQGISGNALHFDELNKPFMNLSFLDKFRIMDRLDGSNNDALYGYQMISKYAADKNDLSSIMNAIDDPKMFDLKPTDIRLIAMKAFPDDVSPREKADVLNNIKMQIVKRPNERLSEGQRNFLRNSFQLIQKKADNGQDFLRLSKVFLKMTDAMGIESSADKYLFESTWIKPFDESKKVFNYITDKLKGKQEESEAFIGLLRGTSIEGAKWRMEFIMRPVKGEDYPTRVKVAHSLAETPGFNSNFQTVLKNTEPGQDPMELVDLMKNIRRYYGDDVSSVKAFVDTKTNISDTGLTIPQGCSVLSIFTTDMEKGIEAMKEIASPVGSESFEDRRNLLAALRDNYKLDAYYDVDSLFKDKKLARFDNSALDDYRLVITSMLPGETLEQAGERFHRVFEVLKGRDNSAEVRDAYLVITESMKGGNSFIPADLLSKALLTGRKPEDVRKILRDGLTEASEKLRKQGRDAFGEIAGGAGSSTDKTHEIIQDNEKVIIGGVRLDKKRFDNILRILDQA